MDTINFLAQMYTFMAVLLHLLALTSGYSSWLVISNIALSAPIGRHMCDQMPLVPQQRHQCEKDPKVMKSIRDGAQLSILECQHQFRHNRWNCSTVSSGQDAFGKIVQREKPHLILTVSRSGSQEAAFVHAITSAGVTYAVTQACSRGDLDGCSCDERKRGSTKGDFIWGGCSDDIKYGMKFAEKFVDASETDRQDARASMNKHNNRVGRRAVKKFIKRKCKCHGQTASCATKTCWDELEDFRKTGDYLKAKFNRAAHVTVRQSDGSITRVKKNGKKQRLHRDHLVYLEGSPNYCKKNIETGSLGTGGRECNKTSKGEDGCARMCCGRGYDSMRVTRVEKCKCKFHWCCDVICQNCTRELDVHTCKPEVDAIYSSSTSTPQINTTSGKGKKRRKNGKRKNKKKKGNKQTRKNRNKREISDIEKGVNTAITKKIKKLVKSSILKSKKRDLSFQEHLSRKSIFLSQISIIWTWWKRLWTLFPDNT